MSMKQKTIEAVMAPSAAHMAGDGFKVHSFFLGNSIIDKKDREKLKSQLMKMLSFLFFRKSRSMNP